jgi:hypothetical protein
MSTAAIPDQLRKSVLLIVGFAALIYALWPPLKFQYLGVAATLLGVAPLAQGYKGADK